jgi:hypothetical protein
MKPQRRPAPVPGPRFGPRAIGTVAGVSPAVVIIGWYLATGGPPEPGLLLIPAAAIVAGWVVGPRATGRAAADLLAVPTYFVVAYLLESTAGLMIIVSASVVDGQPQPMEALHEAATLLVARIAYLPVFGVLLSPAALAWVVTVRAIRDRAR